MNDHHNYSLFADLLDDRASEEEQRERERVCVFVMGKTLGSRLHTVFLPLN